MMRHFQITEKNQKCDSKGVPRGSKIWPSSESQISEDELQKKVTVLRGSTSENKSTESLFFYSSRRVLNQSVNKIREIIDAKGVRLERRAGDNGREVGQGGTDDIMPRCTALRDTKDRKSNLPDDRNYSQLLTKGKIPNKQSVPSPSAQRRTRRGKETVWWPRTAINTVSLKRSFFACGKVDTCRPPRNH